MKIEQRNGIHVRKKKYYSIIFFGFVFMISVIIAFGKMELSNNETLMLTTMDTLKQQCKSFNDIVTADRTKSLFRLADCMLELNRHLGETPELAEDSYLEDCVNELRISGLALLDENLCLETSGYTRNVSDHKWKEHFEIERFESIVKHPAEVYVERMNVDGQYYDICAVSRKDRPGVFVGYYAQPKGRMQDMEQDLSNLLGGLHMIRNGNFIITDDNHILAANMEIGENEAEQEAMVLTLSNLPVSEKMMLVEENGNFYFGAKSASDGYWLYIYFPIHSVFASTAIMAVIFLLLYGVFLLMAVVFKNQSLQEKQQELIGANRQLQETVNILRSLESIYFTIFYVDVKKDHYDSMFLAPWLTEKIPENGTFSEMVNSLISTVVLDQYHKELRERLNLSYIQDALSPEKISPIRHSFYVDYQAVRNGEVKWCSVVITLVDSDEEGRPAHILAVLQDIDAEKTKEMRYQAKILEEAEAARRANVAKTEFLRRISHDIRTPINGIQGYLNIASKFSDDLKMQEICREKVTTSLTFLLDLVNNILDMSKLESSELILEEKTFDLRKLLKEVDVVMEAQAAEHEIEYQSKTRKEDIEYPYLIGSPLHIRQIFLNLTGNAVKYGRKDGHIQVSMRLISEKEDIAVYEFVCSDDGIGISKEFQPLLFEPFTQEANDARTHYHGTGLGLSIVKKLVENMNGTIAFNSEKGVGTTFYVTIPFQIDRNYLEQELCLNTNQMKEVLMGKKVLLIEDNELNMEIAEFLLNEQGLIVEKAWNGKEGVETFLCSEIGYYDFILMDIMMPVMDGLEAVRRIRNSGREDAKKVLVIAMSANAFSDDVKVSLEAGMNAHLSKPIKEQELIQTLQTLFENESES